MDPQSPQFDTTITLLPEQIAELEKQYPGLSETMRKYQQSASDAQLAKSAEAIPALVYPQDVSQMDAQKFAKLGLSYEMRSDGFWLAVYEDPETNKKTKFIYNPQAFVNANPPADVTWGKDGMIEHEVNLHGHDLKSVWHFNRTGADIYIQQLSEKNVKLADNTLLIQTIVSKFSGQMHKAFGIPLTAGSNGYGHLSSYGVCYNASFWLSQYYLAVNLSFPGVGDGNINFGYSLFLQDTSSDI